MKKTLYSKEFLKMQKLAGVITEGQYKTLIKENYSYGDIVLYNGENYFVVASSKNNDLSMTDKLKQKLADSGTDESSFVVIEPKAKLDRTDNLATDQLLSSLKADDMGDLIIVDKDKLSLAPKKGDQNKLSSGMSESIQKGDPIEFHLLDYLESQTSVGDKEAEKIYADNFAGDEEKEIEYKDYNDLTPEDIMILKNYVKKKAEEGDEKAKKLVPYLGDNN